MNRHAPFKALTSFRLCRRLPLIAGMGQGQAERSERPIAKAQAERSKGPSRSPRPSGRAEERRAMGGQGHCKMPLLRDLTRCGCLNVENAVNEVSSAAPPIDRAPQVARSGAQGHGKWGPPFFGFFFWRSKKRNCAAGRISRQTASAKKQKSINTPGRGQNAVIPPPDPCAEPTTWGVANPEEFRPLLCQPMRPTKYQAPSRKTEKRTS